MRPTIEVTHPDGRKETIALTRERTVVGRGNSADIQVQDNHISREHAALEVSGDNVYVVDLGGSNGTWIGATKILANVREPFPPEAVVHVGPAQIRLVSARPGYDPDRDLESQAYMPVAPQRPSAPGPASPPPSGQGAGTGRAAPPARGISPGAAAGVAGQSAAAVELSQPRMSLNAGERNSMQVGVTNQSKIVDHYTLSVVGVPSSWVTLPAGGVELLPRQSGTLSFDVHPPRSSRTPAGSHQLSIAVLNRRGEVVAQTTSEIIIEAYDQLVIDVRPNPFQSRSGGVMIVTVENHGNAETEYRVDAMEASDSLELFVDPPEGTVAPRQSQQNMVRVRPRKRNWVGDARRMNMTVTVTSSRQSESTSAVYTQLSTFPRWLPILAMLCCCILVPLFALIGGPDLWAIVFPTDTPTLIPTETPVPTATTDIPATQTAAWCDLDDDGDELKNCEERDLYQTLTNSKDTDGDGLTDFAEVKQHNTQPNNKDSDGDTLEDAFEVNDPCLSPNSPDTDLDGIQDHLDEDSCTGVTPTPSPVPDFALGGQVNNSDEHLDVLEEARMSWVKIQLRFGLGADAGSAVRDATKFKEKGFKLLLSVVGNREEIERGGYNQVFADFLGEIAPVADGIEVWNEPNIDREWPTGKISPSDYTEMLRAAYGAIKANNPRTIVISAAPAPTGVNSDAVMSDDRFVQGMMAAGARNYMDCIGIHYNVGATPPGSTTGHPDDGGSGHYSYYFLPMLDLYFDTFNPPDAGKKIPVCFTEIGFLSDEGFDKTLAQAGAMGFLWGEGNSVRDQAEWLEESLLRSCRSGKVKLFIVWNVDFSNYGQDPQAGYAILRPNKKCPSCETLSRAVGLLRNEGCMD